MIKKLLVGRELKQSGVYQEIKPALSVMFTLMTNACYWYSLLE